MRSLLLYEICTQSIILLGKIREWAAYPNRILKQRTFLTPRKLLEKGYGTLETCCDCGLTHRCFLREKGLFWQPERPEGYSYKLRVIASPPSEFKEEPKWSER